MFFLVSYVCGGWKSLPEVVENIWLTATVQASTVHLIRNTVGLPFRRRWEPLKHDLTPICPGWPLRPHSTIHQSVGHAGIRRPSGSGGEPGRNSSRSWIATSYEASVVLCQHVRGTQCPPSSGGEGARPFPVEGSTPKMSPSCDSFTGPDRARAGHNGS
ncbi:hypothetical protein LRQ08_29690 (plasmid) [Rhodococcus qingshengii]|uniref:hypothetical protein n=1 Tax=Rhodococcus qingshengii TaxID=334542 RepID=UPI0021136DD0|nr:hypothetical protein [Rhodococcus qingshengii]UUE28635.1 hypothetical protein LRQ08_29690 [Rhodococcus qingshengii]